MFINPGRSLPTNRICPRSAHCVNTPPRLVDRADKPRQFSHSGASTSGREHLTVKKLRLLFILQANLGRAATVVLMVAFRL